MYNLLPILTSFAAEAETHAESSGGIGAIGIDGKALLFQIINFAILLLILRQVAYKPILKALEARRKKIDASLKAAKEIEQAQAKVELHQEKLIAKARQEAEAITATAQKQASEVVATAETRAQQRAEQIVSDGRTQIAEDVKKAKAALKKETLGLVIAATEAIIEERLDASKDAHLLERALSKAGNHE